MEHRGARRRRAWPWRARLPFLSACLVCILGTEPAPGGDADRFPCQTHQDCGDTTFCSAQECRLQEGITVTCGACKACSQCRFNRDAIDREADDPNSPCGDPWMETGRFEFTMSPGVSGNTLTLFVPADFDASSYQKQTARVFQAAPLGLDFRWNNEEGEQLWDGVPERLVPASEGSSRGDHELWCGALEMFDSKCKACFQRERLVLRVSSADAYNQHKGGRPSAFFWRINTWGCEIGEALAPGMTIPSETHVQRRAGAKDGLTSGQASKNIRDSTSQRKPRGGSRRALLFNVNDMPPNNANWLLFSSEPINIHDHYSQGETADGSYCVFRLNETVVTPTKSRRAPRCVQSDGTDCPRCPQHSVCHKFHMTSDALAELDGLRLEQTQNLSLPTTTFRCVCGGPMNPGYGPPAAGANECSDVDECALQTHDCHEMATCVNTRGSFVCNCNAGYESDTVVQGLNCIDVDECAMSKYASGLDEHYPMHNCYVLATCNNTAGSFACVCPQGFVTAEGAAEGTECMHTSSVHLEHAWATGNKIGLFFSWRLETIPHPKDVVSIEVAPIVYPECAEFVQFTAPWDCPDPFVLERRTIFWMFTGTVGCGSQLTIVLGKEKVMDCHVDTQPPVPWAGQVIQQKSAGDGLYYARLYSYSVDQVAATDVQEYNSTNVEDLETLRDSEEYEMLGGLVDCVAEPNTGRDEWDTGAKCRIEIPTWDGVPVEVDTNTGPPIRCGDGKWTPANESCDDGNVQNGDGCDAFCRIEIDTVCTYTYNDNVIEWTEEDPVTGQQLQYYQWVPSENTCVRKLCGDTKMNLYFEECDDGNLIDFDGCSSGCKVERGYKCEHSSELSFDVTPPALVESEICIPFVAELNENDTRADCPICHEKGECMFYMHQKVCSCNRGYAKTIRGNPEEDNPSLTKTDVAIEPHYCTDIDECKYLVVCSEDSMCMNTDGSFVCNCLQGHSQVYDPEWGTFSGCLDDNECNLPRVVGESVGDIRSFPCAEVGGACQNTPGSFKCSCASGFNGTGYANADGCIDHDECLLGTHDCGSTQYCRNLPGSYQCLCNERGFQRRGRECFVGGFYEDNKDSFRLFGWKPTSTQGLAREWDLPMLQNDAKYSAGMMQFLVNHQPPNKVHTHWDKYTISPSDSEKRARTAYLHTAIFSQSHQNTPDLGPFKCGAQVCHDCLEWDEYSYVTKNPQDGGGERRVVVIDKSSGSLAFRASASTSDATWTWSFEGKIDSTPIDSLWIQWIKLNLFKVNVSSLGLPFESLAICRQRTASSNALFARADSDGSSSLNLGEVRDILLSTGEYQDEVRLEEFFASRDINGDAKLNIEEWFGSTCTNYTAANPPPAIQEIATPFTLELSVAGMVPGSKYWNFTQVLSEHKFVLNFSTHEPLVSKSTDAQNIFAIGNYTLNITSREVDPVRRLALSIKNGNGLQSPPPCEINRNGLNDAYSTLHLTSTAPDGLQWVDIGSVRPEVGTEIVNEALASALPHKSQFTRAEYDEFGVSQLFPNSYVQSKPGHGRYFRPVAAETLQPNQKLHGMWQGTCNPRIPARSWNCDVNLNVKEHSGSFELIISGCGGFEITNFATGVMVELSKEGVPWKEQGRTSKMYKNVLVNYGFGVPTGTTQGWTSFASVWWDQACDAYRCTDTRPNSITLNIFRPGESTRFPSEFVTFSSQQLVYPCQVLTLTRVNDDNLQVRSLKSSAFTNVLQQRFRRLELYREFNSSLHEIKNLIFRNMGGEGCDSDMNPFFDSEASILDSPPTMSPDACLSPCFAEMNRSMSEFAAKGVQLWRQFLDLGPSLTSGLATVDQEDFEVSNREYHDLKGFFAARVLHVAEFLARSALTCTGNYQAITCLQYASTFIRPKCRNNLDCPRHAAQMSSLSLDPANGGTAGTCALVCKSDIEDIIVSGHCCAARFESVQQRWADFVLPGRRALEIDFGVYRCLYSSSSWSSEIGSSQSVLGEERCSNAMPEIVTAKHPAKRDRCDDSQSGGQSLRCSFDVCVDYAVPPQCCNKIECKNNGVLEYIGACYCICEPPYAGYDCGESRLQVVGSVAVSGVAMATFQPGQFLEKLEASVTSWDFKPTVEIGSVVPSRRRTVGQNGVTASQRMPERLDRALNHSSHSLGKGGRAKNTQTRQAKGWRRDIPQDQTLEVTFRIVGFGTKLQAMRVVEVLMISMRRGQFSEMMESVGLSMSGDSFASVPRAVQPDGKSACVDEPAPGELLCEAFYKEIVINNSTESEEVTRKPVPLALALGPVAGALIIAVCACMRMDRFFLNAWRSIVNWVEFRVSYEKNRRRIQQVRKDYEKQRFEGKSGGKSKETLFRFDASHLKQQSNHRPKNNDDDQGAVEDAGAQRAQMNKTKSMNSTIKFDEFNRSRVRLSDNTLRSPEDTRLDIVSESRKSTSLKRERRNSPTTQRRSPDARPETAHREHDREEPAISEVHLDESRIKVFRARKTQDYLPEPSPRVNGSETMTTLNFGAFAKARDSARAKTSTSPRNVGSPSQTITSPHQAIGTPAEVPTLSASIEYDEAEAPHSIGSMKSQVLLLRQQRLNKSLNARLPSTESINAAIQSSNFLSSAAAEMRRRGPDIPTLWQPEDIEANVSRSQGYKVREMSIPELQTGSRGGKQTDVERGASKTRRSLKIHIPQHLGDGRSPSSRGVSVMNSSAQDSAGVTMQFSRLSGCGDKADRVEIVPRRQVARPSAWLPEVDTSGLRTPSALSSASWQVFAADANDEGDFDVSPIVIDPLDGRKSIL